MVMKTINLLINIIDCVTFPTNKTPLGNVQRLGRRVSLTLRCLSEIDTDSNQYLQCLVPLLVARSLFFACLFDVDERLDQIQSHQSHQRPPV